MPIINKLVDNDINVISQGQIVANSLVDYLNRHSEIRNKLTKNSQRLYFTTDSSSSFEKVARIFMGYDIRCMKI